MGFDDFAPSGVRPAPKRPVAPEDEDLFDFPLVEMSLDAELPVEARPAPAAAASAPASSATPSSATRGAEVEDLAAVRQAEELIEHIEGSLAEELEPQPAPRRSPQRARLAVGASSPLVLLGGMLLLNLLTFGFLWFVSNNFRSGLEALRDELLVVTRSAPASPVQAAESHVAAPVAVVQQPLQPAPPAPGPANDAAAAKPAPVASAHPLAAFEETSLTLAAQEVRSGDFAAARQRLSRLLALADRIDASVRGDIEARARFLIAESYRAQAAAKELHGAAGQGTAAPAPSAAPSGRSGGH